MKKWMFFIVCMLPLFGWGQALKQGKYVEWERGTDYRSQNHVFPFGAEGVCVIREFGGSSTYELEWYDANLTKVKAASFEYPKKQKLRKFCKSEKGLLLFFVDKGKGDFSIMSHESVTLKQRIVEGELEEVGNEILDMMVLGDNLYLHTSKVQKAEKLWDTFGVINLQSGKVLNVEMGIQGQKASYNDYMAEVKLVDHDAEPELWVTCRECLRKNNDYSCKNWVLRFNQAGKPLPTFEISLPKNHLMVSYSIKRTEDVEGYLLIGSYTIFDQSPKKSSGSLLFKEGTTSVDYEYFAHEGVFIAKISLDGTLETTEFFDAEYAKTFSTSGMLFHEIEWDGEKYSIIGERLWPRLTKVNMASYKCTSEFNGAVFLSIDADGYLIGHRVLKFETIDPEYPRKQLQFRRNGADLLGVYAVSVYYVDSKETHAVFSGFEVDTEEIISDDEVDLDDFEAYTTLDTLKMEVGTENEIAYSSNQQVRVEHWYGNRYVGYGNAAVRKKGTKTRFGNPGIFFLTLLEYTN